MNNNPLVSIVIPVFNGANYLAEAIDSALGQTYKNIEVLVINDGSTDGGDTKRIALKYGDKIRYFEKENGGVATALNFGIDKMQGEYFSWLSHDDVYMPHKIEFQIDFIYTVGDDVAILYSDYSYIDENSNFIKERKLRHVVPKSFKTFFIMEWLLHGCSLLVPYVCFKECGLFNAELRTTQDYDLWLRFSEKFKFIHIPEILIKSRSHPNQDTVKLKPLAIKECDEFCKLFLQAIDISEIESNYDKPVPLYYIDLAKSMQRQGYRQAMKRSFFLGLKNSNKIRLKYLPEYFKNSLKLLKEVIR